MQTEKLELAGKGSNTRADGARQQKTASNWSGRQLKGRTPTLSALSLTSRRLQQLLQGQQWQQMDLNKIIREGKTHLFLLNLLLANFQRRIWRRPRR